MPTARESGANETRTDFESISRFVMCDNDGFPERQMVEAPRTGWNGLQDRSTYHASTHDELQASNADIASLNERLIAHNRQLQARLIALQESNHSLHNLLDSSEIPTICLDRQLRIRWVAPSLNGIGCIAAGDIGRPIGDLSTAGLGDGLNEDAAQVLQTSCVKQQELASANGRNYLRRIVPYRIEQGAIDGVVITFTDITEAKQSAENAATVLRSMADSLEARVRESTAQLRRLNAELTLTEDRERRILARDLHDDLGQLLAIMKIKLSSIEGSERRGILKAALRELEHLIDQANRSVRSLMLQLSPPILQTLGLIPALEWLAEEMDRLYGLSVHVDAEGELPAIDEPARTTLFRCVRELLINVAKHADTPVAQIFCHPHDNGLVCISVTDQGHGFNYQQTLSKPLGDSGFGLISVRERIEFIGGKMEVDTLPGYGTTISIIFPGKQEGDIQGGDVDDHSRNAGR